MEREYHGIVIKESLSDQSVLKAMTLLGEQHSDGWTLLRVEIGGARIDEVLKRVKASLLTEDGVPYYAHFYRGDELIVVFPEKVFYVTPNTETWRTVVDYGVSKGIPRDQMDIKPCRVEDETY
jgi:hypothetical protein